MRTAGKWLTWGGLAVALVCVIVGVTAAVIGFNGLSEIEDQARPVNGTITLDAQRNDTLVLFAPGDDGTVSGAVPRCVVTGPAATEAERGDNVTFTYRGRQVTAFEAHRIRADGEYTIFCDRSDVVVGPPIPASSIIALGLGILLALLGGGFGVLLLIIGIILWVIGSNREKNARLTGAAALPVPSYGPPPGYGPAPGYSPPPGYGQTPAYGPPATPPAYPSSGNVAPTAPDAQNGDAPAAGAEWSAIPDGAGTVPPPLSDSVPPPLPDSVPPPLPGAVPPPLPGADAPDQPGPGEK